MKYLIQYSIIAIALVFFVWINVEAQENQNPGILSVTSTEGITSYGIPGGPFSPSVKTYIITNIGDSSLSWSATNTQSWITVSSTNGLLAPGESLSVSVQINDIADSLWRGNYNDTIYFRNTSNGLGDILCLVSLSVMPVSNFSLPLFVRDSYSGYGILKFGFNPNATYCIDPELGESELFPLPPESVFDVRFIDSRSGAGSCLYSGTKINLQKWSPGVKDTFKILFQGNIPNGGYPFHFSWPSAIDQYYSSLLMKYSDPNLGTMTVNMLIDTTLQINNIAINQITIISTALSAQGNTLSGTIYNDHNANGIRDINDTGLVNWKVNLYGNTNDSTYTSANGVYKFYHVPQGSYIIKEKMQSNWLTISPDSNQYLLTIENGDTVRGIDFGNFRLATISGSTFNDVNKNGIFDNPNRDFYSEGYVGNIISLCPCTCSKLIPDNGYLELDLPPWSPLLQQIGAHVASHGKFESCFRQGCEAGITSTYISSQFTLITTNSPSIIESPHSSCKVYLYHNDTLSLPIDSVFSSLEEGKYSFGALSPGIYFVSEKQNENWIPTTPHFSPAISVTSGINITNQDFGDFRLSKISGKIYNDQNGDGIINSGEVGLQGWKLTLEEVGGMIQDTVSTDSTGVGVFSNLQSGNYIIHELLQENWYQSSFQPNTITVAIERDTLINFCNKIPLSCNYVPKWNMVSLPTKVVDARKSVIFPQAISHAFTFEGSYQTKDTLKIGAGYWLKFDSSRTVNIAGAIFDKDTVLVKKGWNMIGSLSATTSTSCIVGLQGTLIQSSYFGYDNGYSVSNIIVPGKAYWVKVSKDGKLVLKHCGQ